MCIYIHILIICYLHAYVGLHTYIDYLYTQMLVIYMRTDVGYLHICIYIYICILVDLEVLYKFAVLDCL